MDNKTLKNIWPFVIAVIMFCITELVIESERAEAFDEGYRKGYYAGFESSFSLTTTPSRPASGTILEGYFYNESEITVTADSYEDYVVSLKDVYGNTYVSFYVRAGDTVTVGVPWEYLYVYFASGEEWYGYGKGLMFSPSTRYSKDDELRNFVDHTWEYTLYPVTNGNFSETPSSAEEFF